MKSGNVTASLNCMFTGNSFKMNNTDFSKTELLIGL